MAALELADAGDLRTSNYRLLAGSWAVRPLLTAVQILIKLVQQIIYFANYRFSANATIFVNATNLR